MLRKGNSHRLGFAQWLVPVACFRFNFWLVHFSWLARCDFHLKSFWKSPIKPSKADLRRRVTTVSNQQDRF